jgi:hypothetical protein
MRTIYYSSIEDDDVGEVEGMFGEDGNILGMWASNDANWRNEYFREFMRALGIQVDTSGKFNSLLRDKAMEMWG